jgi:hypothetical protein
MLLKSIPIIPPFEYEDEDAGVQGNADFPDIIKEMKDNLQTQFFMPAIILLCWAIWSARNNVIFRGVQPSLPA